MSSRKKGERIEKGEKIRFVGGTHERLTGWLNKAMGETKCVLCVIVKFEDGREKPA